MSSQSGRSRAQASLARAWAEASGRLPSDWSDVYAEVELTSTDDLERGALALAPLNPARYGGARTLRFRIARTSGYGASPGMTRRCLERMDEQAIPGTLSVLRALSGTKHAQTQGPVWLLDGKVV